MPFSSSCIRAIPCLHRRLVAKHSRVLELADGYHGNEHDDADGVLRRRDFLLRQTRVFGVSGTWIGHGDSSRMAERKRRGSDGDNAAVEDLPAERGTSLGVSQSKRDPGVDSSPHWCGPSVKHVRRPGATTVRPARSGCAARKSLIIDVSRLVSERPSPKNRRYFPDFASQTGVFLDFSTILPTLRGFVA